MYDVSWDDLIVVHDSHPQYLSTAYALALPATRRISVQHHRAHRASVLAEQGAWDQQVLGVTFDGTGYGDDGTIWGGELFAGSVKHGFTRVAHLRQAALPGGDAAAHYPVQAAAGFLAQLSNLPDLQTAPFNFGKRYTIARQLINKNVRSFATTSMGRLFDTAAALLGFTTQVTFEGQAAIWLEQIALKAHNEDAYPFPLLGDELDFRPLLASVLQDRLRRRDPGEIARAFHLGIASGLSNALTSLAQSRHVSTIVLSGGVFQNELLLKDLKTLFAGRPITIWTNQAVPPNDGGISLGQAAIAALQINDELPGIKSRNQRHA
jgi:hydrogenase maturation protein HypF